MLGNGNGIDAWRARFPEMTFEDAASLPVPLRRQRAIEAATTPLVALVEDTSWPDAGYLSALDAAFADADVVAASGPVRIAVDLDARTQALACTEYGRFLPRRSAEPVTRLPGNNLAYRRAALLPVLTARATGLIENETHAALQANGGRLAMHPGLGVTYRAADPGGRRLRGRVQHGRLYASGRSASWPFPRRLAFGIAALTLLPFVLCARSLEAMGAGVRPARWIPVGAWICALEGAWAVGEATGYARGRAGSLDAWR